MLRPGKWLSGTRARRRPHVMYHASSWGYTGWWASLLVLHCINLGYYVGVATLYTSFTRTYTYASIHLLSIGIDKSQYPKVSAIHASLAALHALFILLMVASSLHARKLVFTPNLRQVFHAIVGNPCVRPLLTCCAAMQPRKWFTSVSPWVGGADSSSDRPSSAYHISLRITESVSRTGSKIFSRDGLLGVDSVYFDHVLLVRELVETSLQTYQVHRMSQLLPRLWLIRFYVALLVANCWAVPLLHRYYRDRETTRRMYCLLCDAVLDMLASIGISLTIFGTYVPQYNDPMGFGFPYPNWFNDIWLANMQQEFNMMLVASWGDMGSRLMFALGLLQCMQAIKDMLTPMVDLPPASLVAGKVKLSIASSSVAPLSQKQGTKRVSLAWHASAATPNNNVQPDLETTQVQRMPRHDATKADDGPAVEAVSATKNHHGSRLQKVVHFVVHMLGPGVFVVWGCAILAVHLVAETHYSTAACALRLKPWLSSKPGCSAIEINCYDLQSSGHDASMTTALEVFDPERAARVVFRHCPALAMTPKIRQFKNMAGLKVYNSTVVVWDESAAITGTDHKSMRSLFLVRTFFPTGELPAGLLTNDFPPLMVDMVSCITNLRVLPDDLDTKWGRRLQLALEFSQLNVVPDVVVRLQPSLVSFAGCAITSVPAELFEVQWLEAVHLGMTHIHELPHTVARVSPMLSVLFLQFTNVTTFWSWMDRFVAFQMLFPTRLFNAFNTPYCRELEAIAAGKQSDFAVPRTADLATIMDVSTPAKLAYAQQAVDCTPGFLTHFPLPLEDAMHGLH